MTIANRSNMTIANLRSKHSKPSLSEKSLTNSKCKETENFQLNHKKSELWTAMPQRWITGGKLPRRTGLWMSDPNAR
eukprot:2246164-Amphidinium_carterae.1